MFEFKDFYPTPKSLSCRLFSMLKDTLRIKYILEPSAGKGDLIKAYKDWFAKEHPRYIGYNRTVDDHLKIEAVEIEPQLANLLRGDQVNVVWDDFLSYDAKRFYDLILANFPFSEGCEHLLKAIEIQERIGGQILCIVNAETLRNPFTNSREILVERLQEYNAEIEFVQAAFEEAERATDVEVALIYVDIPMRKAEGAFEQEFRRSNPKINVEDVCHMTRKMSKLESLVVEYEILRQSGVTLYQEKMRTEKLLRGMGLEPQLEIRSRGSEHSTEKLMTINEFVESLNLKYWKKMIYETDFLNRLPSNLRSTFESSMERQSDIPFTSENVHYFCEELMRAIPKSYEETVAVIFDNLTRKWHYSESAWSKTIHLFNGWKTNEAFKVGKKVIFSNYGHYWRICDTLNDLNVIFGNISGIKDEIHNNQDLIERIKRHDKNIETQHFLISTYKKGTMHITFKNKSHLDQFNILAAKGKHWLPDSFGKKPFSKMDAEEKEVVISFGLTPAEYDLQLQVGSYVKLIA